NRQVVAAGDENAEVSAVENRDVADQNIFAKLERDGFVAQADGFENIRVGSVEMIVAAHLVEQAGVPRQTTTVDHAMTGDENIGEILAPDQTVVKITMTAVLVGDADKRLRLVIGVQVLRRAENGCARIN